MKQLKKSPRLQLEKFSTIFMQLGLVLVLFIVFISLEYETEQTAMVVEKGDDPTIIYDLGDIQKPLVFVKEQAKVVERRVERPITTIIDDPVVVDNDDKETEIITKADDTPVIDVVIKDDVPEEDIIDEDDEPKGITFVSKIPVFKGCENLSEKEGRKCFDNKMNKLVQRHFNSGLANELGLRSGKHRIYTQFVIDKSGKVTDVKINAPHSRLKKETNRVVSKIPDFTPGENNGKKVKVKYTLPISFKVE